jgi:hypothetical protein
MLLTTDDLAQGVRVEDVLQYCAPVIASFLGAVYLGGGGTEGRHALLCWGAMPSLFAWILLVFPAYAASGEFALLFAAILSVDRYSLPLSDTQYWQTRLRTSIVVIVEPVIAALGLADRRARPKNLDARQWLIRYHPQRTSTCSRRWSRSRAMSDGAKSACGAKRKFFTLIPHRFGAHI